jgi:hypothetical protein
MSDIMRVYVVTMDTPLGRAVVEVPTTQGSDAAGRRARVGAVAVGWGDIDEVTVVSVEEEGA